MSKYTHTLVIEYPEGAGPRYHAGMEILGGRLVAVDFGGNRLEVAEVLQEALESCLLFLENDAEWMDAEPERRAARAAIAKANEVAA